MRRFHTARIQTFSGNLDNNPTPPVRKVTYISQDHTRPYYSTAIWIFFTQLRFNINEVKVKLYFSITAALEGGEWSAARPGRTLPPGKTRYPLYRRLGGPQDGLDGPKISSPPGFDPEPSSP